MNRNEKYLQGQQFKRLNEVKVSEDERARIVGAGIAHLVAGNTEEYMLMMNSLGKLDTNTALLNKMDQIGDALQLLANMNAPKSKKTKKED